MQAAKFGHDFNAEDSFNQTAGGGKTALTGSSHLCFIQTMI
jgi:hypothetical protein